MRSNNKYTLIKDGILTFFGLLGLGHQFVVGPVEPVLVGAAVALLSGGVPGLLRARGGEDK